MAIIYTYPKKSTPVGTDELVISDSEDKKITKQIEISSLPFTNNDGTVTSVDLTVPTGFIVTGGPITTAGVLNMQVSGASAGQVLGYDGIKSLWTNVLPSATISINGGMSSPAFDCINAEDYLVPYNQTIGLVDGNYFNVTTAGGLNTQGSIEVLKNGVYMFFVEYSCQNLFQNQGVAISSTTSADAFIFLRITLTTNPGPFSPVDLGSKQFVIDQHIVSTSLNGEATATGAGIIRLEAGTHVGVIGFQTGGAGPGNTTGVPLANGVAGCIPNDNNNLYNRPTFTLIKIEEV